MIQKKLKNNLILDSDIKLWLYPKIHNNLKISKQEILWSKKLIEKRKEEYMHSRSFLRYSLSSLFKIEPLNIPIIAKPGEAPKLSNDLGFISLSHCNDATLIGWSKYKLGVDIEKKDRLIKQNLINKYIFNDFDLNKFNEKEIKENSIVGWCSKESAIKWEEGKLLRDIRNWRIQEDFKEIKNKLSKTTLALRYKFHKDWCITFVIKKQI